MSIFAPVKEHAFPSTTSC